MSKRDILEGVASVAVCTAFGVGLALLLVLVLG
jgi:hypothetical protein